MPFDIENCVRYNSNYLKGFTSERRDTNIEQLKGIINVQAKDIARISANETLTFYDRGVSWKNEQLNVMGEQWKAAYLPVWLYSYQQVKKEEKILHYVAVNARTKEVMGSVPIHIPKLLIISFIIEMISVVASIYVDWDYSWIFLFAGVIYFFIIYSKYRNASARHEYETDTKTQISNIRKIDDFIQHKQGLTDSKMINANNLDVKGKTEGSKILDAMTSLNGDSISVIKNNNVANFIKNNINKE